MKDQERQPFKITRRRLGEIATSTIMGLSRIGREMPHLLPPATERVWQTLQPILAPEIDEEVRERVAIGTEIRKWILPDGTPMVRLSPELDLAGQVYQSGIMSPYLPRVEDGLKVSYLSTEATGVFRLSLPIFDLDSPIRIIAQSPTTAPFEIPLLKSARAEIILSPQLRRLKARPVVAAKEANQITDYVAYCTELVRLLRQEGARFTLKGASSGQIPEALLNVSIALAHTQIEFSRGMVPWLQRLVDEGSFMRVGSITFANWYLNYPQEHKLVDSTFMKAGHDAAGFLQQEGWLKQQGMKVVWANGRVPQIAGGELYNLLARF